jgi:colicin import membrane protein
MNSQNKILENHGTPGFNLVFQNRKIGIVFFTISLILHALFFFGMILFHNFKLPNKPIPQVIQIDLVSFVPEPESVQEVVPEKTAKSEEISPKDVISVKKEAIKKEVRKIPTIKPAINLKTKPKNLKALMAKKKKNKIEKLKEKQIVKKLKPKKEVEPDKLLEEAREKLEKKIEEQNQSRLTQALNRLKKKVKNQDEKQNPATGYSKKGYKPIDIYKMVVGAKIEQNWVFNDALLARIDQNLEVRILIKILKSGEIRDIIYETKSGSRYLDESAKKAIKKVNSLPQLPTGIRSFNLVVIFTPKGLK